MVVGSREGGREGEKPDCTNIIKGSECRIIAAKIRNEKWERGQRRKEKRDKNKGHSLKMEIGQK